MEYVKRAGKKWTLPDSRECPLTESLQDVTAGSIWLCPPRERRREFINDKYKDKKYIKYHPEFGNLDALGKVVRLSYPSGFPYTGPMGERPKASHVLG